MFNFCLLLIIGIVFIVVFLKKEENMMYYNYSTEELLKLKDAKFQEWEFATSYIKKLELESEIDSINEELENRKND